MTTGRIISASAVLAISLAGGAIAQSESNRVAAETDWAVFEGADPKECWAVTAPKETGQFAGRTRGFRATGRHPVVL